MLIEIGFIEVMCPHGEIKRKTITSQPFTLEDMQEYLEDPMASPIYDYLQDMLQHCIKRVDEALCEEEEKAAA